MADSITARSGWDKRVEVVKKLTDPNRKVNCQKCQKGASKSALLSWRNEDTTITVEIRWDEKAGLQTGCGVRSQVIDVLEAQIKRRPAMKCSSMICFRRESR